MFTEMIRIIGFKELNQNLYRQIHLVKLLMEWVTQVK